MARRQSSPSSPLTGGPSRSRVLAARMGRTAETRVEGEATNTRRGRALDHGRQLRRHPRHSHGARGYDHFLDVSRWTSIRARSGDGCVEACAPTWPTMPRRSTSSSCGGSGATTIITGRGCRADRQLHARRTVVTLRDRREIERWLGRLAQRRENFSATCASSSSSHLAQPQPHRELVRREDLAAAPARRCEQRLHRVRRVLVAMLGDDRLAVAQ